MNQKRMLYQVHGRTDLSDDTLSALKVIRKLMDDMKFMDVSLCYLESYKRYDQSTKHYAVKKYLDYRITKQVLKYCA